MPRANIWWTCPTCNSQIAPGEQHGKHWGSFEIQRYDPTLQSPSTDKANDEEVSSQSSKRKKDK